VPPAARAGEAAGEGLQKKNKKGKPITKDVFAQVVGKLDYSLRATSPLLADSEHLGLLFATLDVNHDGTRTSTFPAFTLLLSALPEDTHDTRTREHIHVHNS